MGKYHFWNMLPESCRELWLTGEEQIKPKEHQEPCQLTQLFFSIQNFSIFSKPIQMEWVNFSVSSMFIRVCSFQFVSLENISFMWNQSGVLTVTQVF